MSGTARRRALLAAFGVLALTAGLVPGSPAAAQIQDADVSLRYACDSAPGQRVTVRVRNTFPSTGTVGKPVKPGKATVTMTLPAALLGGLATADAAVVTGTLNLGMLVSPPPPTSVDWTGLAVAQAAVRGGQGLTLTASGAVPPVPVTAGGPMVFSAGQLTLTLKPRKADGSAAVPDTMSFTCAPGLGQNSTVTTVFASGAGESPKRENPQPRSVAPPAGDDQESYCPPGGDTVPDLQYLPPDEPLDHPEYVIDADEPKRGCAMAYGHSNVKKLDGAARATAEAYLIVGQRVARVNSLNYTSQLGSGTMYPDPVEATFLTYGFMPTTARLELVPVGQMNVVVVGPWRSNLTPPRKERTTVHAKVMLRVRDVRVNGTPLDVGDDCRSAQPMDLVLEGREETVPSYTVEGGGLIQGHNLTIPPFTGCGVGEDLDDLFTSSISGDGNYLRLIQGPLCGDTNQDPPEDDAVFPCPMQRYGWTVDPGGDFTATASEGVRLVGAKATISCDSAVLKGSLPEFATSGQNISMLEEFSLSGCTGPAPLDRPFNWTFTANRPMHFMTLDPSGGSLRGQVSGLGMRVTAGACRFNTSSAGEMGFNYVNATGTFDFKAGVLVEEKPMTLLSSANRCGETYQPGDTFNLEGRFTTDPTLRIGKP